MLARIAHDLRRGVEAHRLGVQQRAGEDAGVVPLDPGRGIDQQREAGRVAFGEAVAAEPLDLRESSARRSRRRSRWRAMPFHEAVAEFADVAVLLEGGQRPAQPVGLLGVKPAPTMAICIACSWNSGTPSVLPSTFPSSSEGKLTFSCPFRRRRKGCTMSPWIGPGRMIATWITRS
jgi:hypothetical protein